MDSLGKQQKSEEAAAVSLVPCYLVLLWMVKLQADGFVNLWL